VTRFSLELTQHVIPRGSQYIRRYGLCAALRRTGRTKGKWSDMPHVMRLAPAGWKAERLQDSDPIQSWYEETAVPDQESCRTWARLIAQVYEGYAPRCPPEVSALPLTHECDCCELRFRRGSKDPTASGENRLIVTGVRSNFALLTICLPACFGE
jgi:hypothetical protein